MRPRSLQLRRPAVLPGRLAAAALAVLAVTAIAQFAPAGVPVITVSPTPTEIPAGQVFVYHIHATNDPTMYAATGLPAGLTLNPTTGEIRGVAAYGSGGLLPVKLYATNPDGTGTATQLMFSERVGPVEMPVVRRVDPPAAATYGPGDVLHFAVEYDAPYGGINYTGTPRIPLRLGNQTRYATCTGAAGKTLTFTYVITSADPATSAVSLGHTIDANGGSITDRTGLPCALALP